MSKDLIKNYLSGQSAKYLIEALVDQLPDKVYIESSIRRELPKKTKFKLSENVVFIECEPSQKIKQSIDYLQLVYPELEFIINKK